jgi:hypothetical protein
MRGKAKTAKQMSATKKDAAHEAGQDSHPKRNYCGRPRLKNAKSQMHRIQIIPLDCPKQSEVGLSDMGEPGTDFPDFVQRFHRFQISIFAAEKSEEFVRAEVMPKA